jgi:hypothetical protein
VVFIFCPQFFFCHQFFVSFFDFVAGFLSPNREIGDKKLETTGDRGGFTDFVATTGFLSPQPIYCLNSRVLSPLPASVFLNIFFSLDKDRQKTKKNETRTKDRKGQNSRVFQGHK